MRRSIAGDEGRASINARLAGKDSLDIFRYVLRSSDALKNVFYIRVSKGLDGDIRAMNTWRAGEGSGGTLHAQNHFAVLAEPHRFKIIPVSRSE